MQDVLNLQPKPKKSLRAFVPFFLLSAALVWVTHLPPTALFWFGVLTMPILVGLQVMCGIVYRWLLPRCQARLNEVGARGLSAYLQKRLTDAYHGALSNTRLVVALCAINAAVAVTMLTNALLIPTVLWEGLAFFAFGSALFIGAVALESSWLMVSMFGLLLKRI